MQIRSFDCYGRTPMLLMLTQACSGAPLDVSLIRTPSLLKRFQGSATNCDTPHGLASSLRGRIAPERCCPSQQNRSSKGRDGSFASDRKAAMTVKQKGAPPMPTYRKNPEVVSKLTPEQYRVTQTDGTERPYPDQLA